MYTLGTLNREGRSGRYRNTSPSEHESRYSHNHNDTDKTDRDTNAFDNLI